MLCIYCIFTVNQIYHRFDDQLTFYTQLYSVCFINTKFCVFLTIHTTIFISGNLFFLWKKKYFVLCLLSILTLYGASKRASISKSSAIFFLVLYFIQCLSMSGCCLLSSVYKKQQIRQFTLHTQRFTLILQNCVLVFILRLLKSAINQ